MASKYKVLPLDGRGIERLATPRPEMSAPRDQYVYYSGTGELEASSAADVRNRSHTITAEVEIPKAGAQGVLLAHGSSFGGYTFFVNKEQKLQFHTTTWASRRPRSLPASSWLRGKRPCAGSSP